MDEQNEEKGFQKKTERTQKKKYVRICLRYYKSNTNSFTLHHSMLIHRFGSLPNIKEVSWLLFRNLPLQNKRSKF